MPTASRIVSAMTLATVSALALACAPMQEPGSTTDAPVSGWYMQHDARASFQPCGATQRLAIVGGGELRQRADEFGLQDGDPVYVRLLGDSIEGDFRLSRVTQFGSPVPVRDCPMTGTTIQQ